MNTPLPAPRISRAPRFPLVWIVPAIAALVGGWMLVREWGSRGPEITIDFADGSGIESGRTILDHKGVAVGLVTDVSLTPEGNGVIVRLRLNRDAAPLAREGTLFWITHPEIGLSGIRGLETLLTGAKLNLRSGTGAPATHFTGLEKIPPPELSAAGRTFILQSSRLGSLTAGAPVFYRDFKVGTVESSRLADDATAVLVRIHVEAAYADLVRTSSRFWNAGGLSFKVGLLGAEMKNTSLESLLSGGISFATPETAAPPAAEGTVFTLSAEPDGDWLKWSPRIPVKSPETVENSRRASADRSE